MSANEAQSSSSTNSDARKPNTLIKPPPKPKVKGKEEPNKLIKLHPEDWGKRTSINWKGLNYWSEANQADRRARKDDLYGVYPPPEQSEGL